MTKADLARWVERNRIRTSPHRLSKVIMNVGLIVAIVEGVVAIFQVVDWLRSWRQRARTTKYLRRTLPPAGIAGVTPWLIDYYSVHRKWMFAYAASCLNDAGAAEAVVGSVLLRLAQAGLADQERPSDLHAFLMNAISERVADILEGLSMEQWGEHNGELGGAPL